MRRILWWPRAPQDVVDHGEIVELEPEGQIPDATLRRPRWDEVGYTPAPDPGSTAGIWEALRHA